MTQPVTIENDAIQMDVWPQLGGKVSSLVDKSDNHELLFGYPVEYPVEHSQYDLPYQKGWYAGWDECFPAIAASRYVGHPYDGIPVPDHGEIWSLPTTAVPTRNGITTVWHGLRFGYRLTRKLYLDGSAVVSEYTLVNLAPFEFRFVWCQHALLGMTAPVELDLPGNPRFRLSHDQSYHEIQQEFTWPVTEEEGENLSKPAGLPTKGAWKAFSTLPITSPIHVRYPSRSRRLTMEYRSEDGMAAYWGLWINTGGWGNHRHFSIQPTTGRFDQIDRAIKDGTTGTVAALGRRAWSIRLTLGS
jgi:hypothetical protein